VNHFWQNQIQNADDQHNKLCVRIMKLRTNTEQQKKLLRKLEHNTSLAQHQLNTVFDPVYGRREGHG
jgi:phage shock protein A